MSDWEVGPCTCGTCSRCYRDAGYAKCKKCGYYDCQCAEVEVEAQGDSDEDE